MNAKRCVLAYSGGLDTSAIIVWLREQAYEVHAVLVDVGQDEDLHGLCDKALRFGAASAEVRDARPAMFKSVIPMAIALSATYEGDYRLGTALARPFIALEQVRRARELGGATLIHGATGKGNDQIRFEFAYRSLAPDCPVLAPWKTWSFAGRRDLVKYLQSKGCNDDFEVVKTFSLDENLWHLSIEGGPLEDAAALVDVPAILETVSDRFAGKAEPAGAPPMLTLAFHRGVPVALNGVRAPLSDLIANLNRDYRHAPWAWDFVIENRFTGIKSRGIYVNPAAKVLQLAVDALARCCLNKPTYDEYAELGRRYGGILYRGEYFSDQRLSAEASAAAMAQRLTGEVTIQLQPVPYVSRIDVADSIFQSELATFEAGAYDHADAKGFIALSWLSSIGRPFAEQEHADPLEAADDTPPDFCKTQSLHRRGLVSSAL
ncbi:MAG: argininosuccinate synthase [Phycisphaerae bacterium]